MGKKNIGYENTLETKSVFVINNILYFLIVFIFNESILTLMTRDASATSIQVLATGTYCRWFRLNYDCKDAWEPSVRQQYISFDMIKRHST